MNVINIKLKGTEILDEMGLGSAIQFDKTSDDDADFVRQKRILTTYKQDFFNIVDRFCSDKHNNSKSLSVNGLAIAIVWEIIGHYNIRYDLQSYLERYNVSFKTFNKYYKEINKWCSKNYWKDNQEYWIEKMKNVLNV